MTLRRVREFFFPRAAEQDPVFRQSIIRASHAGLPALGCVEIAAATLLIGRPAAFAAVALIGLATLASARFRWSRERGRWIVLGSAACALAATVSGGEDLAHAAAMEVMLTAVVAAPLLPVHVLVLGGAAELFYRDVFLGALTALGTGIAALLYQRRIEAHREHQEALRIAEALSGAQLARATGGERHGHRETGGGRDARDQYAAGQPDQRCRHAAGAGRPAGYRDGSAAGADGDSCRRTCAKPCRVRRIASRA